MFKKLLLFSVTVCAMVISTLWAGISQPRKKAKVIIWDLGNTLLSTDTFGFASEIGFADFLLYPLLDWKNPLHVRNIVFSILDSLAEPQKGDACLLATSQGRVLPTVMCNWLAGKESGADICLKAGIRIKEYDRAGFFISTRQKRLVQQTIDTMFNPQKLARHMRPIKQALKLLEECALECDEQGRPRHKLYILSNWDPESFENLLYSAEFQKIVRYIDPENIVISGDVGVIKPHPTIYAHFINEFDVNPADCILIDDQWENIESARRSGMQGVLLENRNYRKLKEHLKGLHVF